MTSPEEEQEKREESVRAATDAAAAYELQHLMTELSEEYYSAGWLMDLEFRLWEVLEGNTRSFACGGLPSHTVERLRNLRTRAGGWWHLTAEYGELFETSAVFAERVKNRNQKRSS